MNAKQAIGAGIKARRIELGMSQTELAKKVGYTADSSKSTIAKIEKGLRDVSRSKIPLFAEALHLSIAELLGIEDDTLAKNAKQSSYTKKIPMLREIACGQPIFANQEYDEYVEIGHGIRADFALTARGDSMIDAKINDGDIIFCTSQSTVNNGEIGVVIIDDEATLKRVYYYLDKQRLILQPENKKYEPMVFVGEELDTIRIIGKAVALKLN